MEQPDEVRGAHRPARSDGAYVVGAEQVARDGQSYPGERIGELQAGRSSGQGGAARVSSGASSQVAEHSGGGRNVARAILTGLGFGVVTLLAFHYGPVSSLVFVAAVVSAAAAEVFGSLRQAGYRPATLVGMLGTVGALVAGYERGAGGLMVVVVLVLVLSFLWFMLRASRGRPTPGIAATLLGFLWVGLLGGFAGLLLDPSAFPHRHGVAYLLGTLLVVVAYDVGAYAVGARFGRRRVAPRISPNKTVEGALGGTVLAFLAAGALVSLIHPWTEPEVFGLAAIVAVFAPLGDLAESMVKRDLGVKDMGSFLPGHGGFLDRLDGVLLVLPAAYYMLVLAHAH